MKTIYGISISYVHPEGYCRELDSELDLQAGVVRWASGMGMGAWEDAGRDLEYQYPTENSAQLAIERFAKVADEWQEIAPVRVGEVFSYEVEEDA